MSNGERRKQSFLAGALTSSAGVFISKAIGLLYVVPFTAICGEGNMAYYSAAFSYYDMLLQICSAGLPFAIAAIVAKYANREDYKTVLLVRKLSTSILIVSGFLMALLLVFSSGLLSSVVLGPEAVAADIGKMRTTFSILAIALFLVPILYSYRGFYQGFKEMKTYAFSQVLEQIVRVVSLLLLGWFVVYILQMDRINSIYMAVLATSLGALAAIIFYVKFDHSHYGPIARAARAQETEAKQPQEIVKELLLFGLPYFIISLLGNTQTLINVNFFIGVNTGLGMDYDLAKTLFGIIQLKIDKLTSIPQVLAIGFSAGIVPYMTVALENRNKQELQKYILQCLDTVLYIGVPICFSMLTLAGPVYYVMYGGANLNYGIECLRWGSILAMVTTLTPIINSMLMTLHLGKESIFYLIVSLVVKCATFYPLIRYFGYTGAISSSILSSLSLIYLGLAKIKSKYKIRYSRTGKRLFKILLACLCMNGGFALLKLCGLQVVNVSRTLALLEMVIYVIVGGGIYFYISSLMKIPQSIFEMSIKQLFQRIFHRRSKEASAE